MTKIRTDPGELNRCAVKLWRMNIGMRQTFGQADREITNLPNAWAGDDELHFRVKWQETKAENAILLTTERGLSVFAEHLLYAAGVYREAQTDAVNAAMKLVK